MSTRVLTAFQSVRYYFLIVYGYCTQRAAHALLAGIQFSCCLACYIWLGCFSFSRLNLVCQRVVFSLDFFAGGHQKCNLVVGFTFQCVFYYVLTDYL